MEQVYTPSRDYKVLVNCMTYNQSKYIEDALNGFAMQKTDFPFVCLVMDDASTDGEQEVIKAWMERECDMLRAENVEIEKSFVTIVPHKTNSSCSFAFYFLKENLYGTGKKTPLVASWREHCEYEALCEGDDYWIHPGKLQMQADILDKNKEYQMCAHNYYSIKSDTKQNMGYAEILDHDGIIPIERIIMNRGVPQTATFFFRRESIANYPEVFHKIKMVGDYQCRLICALRGGVYYINKPMSCYRLTSSGSWTSAMAEKRNQFGVHISEMIDFAKAFDEYTKGKYHRVCEKRIDYCLFLDDINKKDLHSAFKRDFFRSLPFNERIKVMFMKKYPKAWNGFVIVYSKIVSLWK